MDRKILTFPSEVHKNGCDNIEGNLIVHKGDIINQKNAKYKVISFLGKGSYGQVFKCVNLTNNELVALKISKGELIYTKQSFKESNVLHKLNPMCEDLIVKIYHDFDYKGHHCLVLELLSLNLYDYLKLNNFEGIEHRHLRKIAKQCLRCLSVIHSNQIIHSDIKPENILISSNDLDVKIIDLGACFYMNQPIREDFYIQSRYYRAPEVLKREHISTSIDIWSLGCVLYELYMGKPLFQGSDNFDQLKRISYFFGNNMLKTRMETFKILPNYPRKHSFCQEKNNELINSPSNLQEQSEKIYYETCEEYKYGDKTIKNERKSSFVENVKRNYLRKEDCIKLLHFKGEKKENDDFLDLLFMMIQPYYLLRPSAMELLNHKYLVDDYVAGGMVTNLGEQVDPDNNRLINPSPTKIDNKTFSSGFSFNDPENKARRFTSHIRKNTKK